ncbi:MAG: hypothetical protein K6G80_06370 [Treponema sp.]|nr:hypothetical protein [Treponema sp.]
MMKKLFLAVVVALAAVTVQVSAENSSQPDKVYTREFIESAVTYRNVQVYKVFDYKNAYVVEYRKGHRDVGMVSIPKRWYSELPRKLNFRALPRGMEPYMTLISKEGAFERVVLTMPIDRTDPYWGISTQGQVEDADKDTLEVEY